MPSPTSIRYSLAWPSRKIRPRMKVNVNQRRSANGSPFSAWNTPIWQVTDENTSTSVNGSAYQTLRCGVCSVHNPRSAARIEKYIANSAAKNISSLDSQTIVPTLTMLGLVREWIRLLSIAEAAVTRALLPLAEIGKRPGARVGPINSVPGAPDLARMVGTA